MFQLKNYKVRRRFPRDECLAVRRTDHELFTLSDEESLLKLPAPAVERRSKKFATAFSFPSLAIIAGNATN
jgi:hypothetical protein